MDQLPVAARARVTADAQAAFFLAWTLPLAAWLGATAVRADRARAERSWPSGWAHAGAQETTVSALDRLVRTSWAPRRDDHQVLDPHAERARQVDAGLDRHDVAGAQRLLAGACATGAGPRGPRGRRRGRGRGRSARRGRPARSPRARPRRPRGRSVPARTAASACSLGREHELVDLARLRGDALAGRVGARAVRAVALVAARPSRSSRARRAGSSPSRGSACGSAPWAPAATIEGKLGASRAEAAHAQLQLDRHLALGAPDEPVFEHLRSASSASSRGGADAGQLAGVLDRAQPLDRARARRRAPSPRPAARARRACAR